MVHPKPTHRHLIALPLAAVLLAVVGLSNAVAPVSASLLATARRDLVVSAAEVAKELDLPSGLHLSLEPGAEAHLNADGTDITVSRGSALADAQGLAMFSLPCLTVSVLHSTAYVSVSDQSVSVAAVQGPLLLQSCDGRLLLLGEGEQAYMSSDSIDVSTVPAVWLMETQSRLASSAPPETSVSHIYSVPFSKDASSVDVTSAFQRAELETDGVTTLLAFRLLPILSRFDDAVKEAVFSSLFSSDALRTQVVRALPYAVSTNQLTLNEAVMEDWTDAAAIFAATDSDAMRSLLDHVALLPSFLADAGYPKQAHLWMQALRDTIALLRPLVDASDRESLDALLTRASNHVPAEQPVILQKEDSATTAFSDDQLVVLTKDVLSRSEALQTAVTRVIPDAESQTARVEGIYVSENGRDIAYDFTYAPGSEMISSVMRDGIKLPNQVSVDVFFPSLRKEAP